VPQDNVAVSLQLNKLKAVNTKAQTFTVEARLRLVWNDSRLAFDPRCINLDSSGAIGVTDPRDTTTAVLSGDPREYLWRPDLYSPSEATQREVVNSAFWISPGGSVWWTQKVLSRRRRDTQLCSRLASICAVAHTLAHDPLSSSHPLSARAHVCPRPRAARVCWCAVCSAALGHGWSDARDVTLPARAPDLLDALVLARLQYDAIRCAHVRALSARFEPAIVPSRRMRLPPTSRYTDAGATSQ
jgi:hypothetical protein